MTQSPIVEILPDKAALIERSLDVVMQKLTLALTEREIATIALSGGSTPKPLYEGLADQSLPWDKLHVFWGDERYVAPEHPDSNEGMARHVWLDRISIPPENIHATPTHLSDPTAAATQYEAEIRRVFATEAPAVPAFDVILLGMGDDAHTASLFPHTPALSVSDRLVTVGNKAGQPRITFTVPLINQARCVLFLVAGENKQPALAQVFASEADAMSYPSRLIQPQGELRWLLDQAAGANL
ncbi:MAG: 6-phosphogluconolactonase [Synechococcales bacterium]|nr:6-phosphogluconolactonase [Synechococcales bacterium]